MLTHHRKTAVRPAVVAAVVLLGSLGCGPAGPKTYPIQGKVELVAGDVAQLTGSHVEAVLANDPTVRTSGTIRPDGGFTLETLRAGTILKGTQEGTYQVRIILPDDDRKNRRLAARALAPRFLQFNTSGLSFQVPADDDVTLRVSQR